MKKALSVFCAFSLFIHSVPAHAFWPFGTDWAARCGELAGSPYEPNAKGKGVPLSEIDATKAIAACQSALDSAPDSAEIRYRLGRALVAGKKYQEALGPIRKAAEQGYASAQHLLGWMYYYGNGVTKELKVAFLWFRTAGEQRLSASELMVGEMYYVGLGVDKDLKEAFHWYQKAAEQGEAAAQHRLALMYIAGSGVAENKKEAFVWCRKAAEQGYTDAQADLGVLYQLGTGVAQDPKEAVFWYRKAAEQGNSNAQFNLGGVYDKGIGVTQDSKEAVTWYRKAAEQGNATAQNDLGAMYYNGTGVAKDTREAVTWFLKSAAQRNIVAINNLANHFSRDAQMSNSRQQAIDLLHALLGIKSTSTSASHKWEEAGDPRIMLALGRILFAGGRASRGDMDAADRFFGVAKNRGSKEAFLYEGDYAVSKFVFDRQRGMSGDSHYDNAILFYRLARDAGDRNLKELAEQRIAALNEEKRQSPAKSGGPSINENALFGLLAIGAAIMVLGSQGSSGSSSQSSTQYSSDDMFREQRRDLCRHGRTFNNNAAIMFNCY